ncbi:NAD(P)-dependent alcohol dehydrogenase [Pseudonocardia sp. ICBG1293]|uniref:NAD(P)-dependent alcohol dehydrogenase n=1 Tax=Pseudonocardia sp. ICBG1293 TaxID=2844382 RepID=UPI001CCB67A2|nr:NAD(P)-dependent alcohol dehydrogenase [Pseudonocardia sp. ICBG1293]
MSDMTPATMRVVEYDRHGGPEVLTVRTAPVPRPGPGEVLVRVAAASASRGEDLVRTGALNPLRGRTLPARVGTDLAGTVAAVTEGVGFRVGQRVWGLMPHSAFGAMAGFVAVPGDQLARIPDGLDLVDAAAAPAVGTTAAHALRDLAKLTTGERLLVRGASGGVGSVAVQLGHAWGAHVTALAGAANLRWVRDLGADVVLDHRRTAPDDLRDLAPFDVVLDLVGTELDTLYDLLSPGGRLVPLGVDPADPLGSLRDNAATAEHHPGRAFPFSNDARTGELTALATLVETGALRVLVHERFTLDDVAEAYRRVEAGGVRGKIVVMVDPH